jgi:FAD/FMN-containing dehydrogenase/Fe-S oxidoreductase
MTSRRAIAETSAAGAAVAAQLRRLVAGRVSTSAVSRWLYSTDASGYRVVPEAVLVAGSVDDLFSAAAVAAEHGLPLTVRGAGTSLAGQAVGPGLVIDCFKLDRIIAIDPDRRLARVEPGVIQASLNAASAPFGLEFGPDTSTVDQATIAGMVGNNSSGSRSIVYGESKDKVRRIAAVLGGGEGLLLGPGPDDVRGPEGPRVAAALAAIGERHRAAIAGGRPRTSRCTSGYNLRELLASTPNPARLLAGSEGTLALFAELEVELDPRPPVRVGAALTFAALLEALEANAAILRTDPSAVELLDLPPLRAAPGLSAYARLAPLLAGDEQAMLTVEYQGEEDEAREGLARLQAMVSSLGAVQVVYLTDAAALAEAAALRRAVLPLLMGAPGAERPAAFVEDTAVAPELLSAFVADFQRIVAEHGARASFTGHASAGCLHVRPLLDLKTAAGVARMDALAHAVGRLVREYHGAISGEHGCGRSRSWFLPELFGPELMAAFAALKDAFDPDGLLAPGIVLDGGPATDHLRFGAEYRADGAWRPRLAYGAEGGFDLAIERCFGAGLCKKLSGTMCPPAAATRDESLSTRARANVLQGLLCGALTLDGPEAVELGEVLGTCVACKACKAECPAGVDMAALKVEWLAELRSRDGVPALARAVGDFRRLARLASPVAPIVNALAASPAGRMLTDHFGVAHERPLPAFAARRFSRVAASDAAPEVVVFADCFVEYQEPEVGVALTALLRAAGRRVAVLDAGCCGRTALSTGQIDKARRAAAAALAALAPHAAAGRVVAFMEPSCHSLVCDDWARLLPDDERVALVAGAARLGQSLVAEDAAAGRLRFAAGGRAIFHPHCHERAVAGLDGSLAALAAVPGLELDVLDAGCCGMSGVFGYEAGHYATSVAIAERALLPAVRRAPAGVAVLATGTSCRTQIRDLSGRVADHPLVFLRDRLAD